MEINKELAKQFLDLLTGTKEFILTQAPEVIQQLLHYKTIMYIYGMVIYAIVWILGLGIIPYFGSKKNRKDYGWDSDTWSWFGFSWAITLTISIPLFVEIIPDFILINTAPKVYLIEYLTKLIK